MSRLGILGGTFNPPHHGHLACARAARDQLGLDVVLLMPAGVPPHKEVPADPGPEVRYDLCRRAIEGEEGLDVSRLEIDRPGRSYTVDTLTALRERSPQDELTFIVGGDMAKTLPSWREPEAVLRLATVAVAERSGAERAEIDAALAPLDAAGRIRHFDMPRVDVSSSEVRARVAAGRPIGDLVPSGVAARIAAEGLYA